MQWPWVLRLDSFTYIRPLFSRGFSKSKHSIDNVSFTLCTALFPYFHSFYHLGDGRQHGSIECENWRLAIDRPISARVANIETKVKVETNTEQHNVTEYSSIYTIQHQAV